MSWAFGSCIARIGAEREQYRGSRSRIGRFAIELAPDVKPVAPELDCPINARREDR
jgi:hypothetical protein